MHLVQTVLSVCAEINADNDLNQNKINHKENKKMFVQSVKQLNSPEFVLPPLLWPNILHS